MMAGWKRISMAVGVLAALASVPARAQTPTPNPNQTTANAVAAALRTSPSLRGQRIDIEAVNGQVTLVGTLAHPAQRHEALARAQRVPGVVAVIDRLRVAPDARVQPAQYQVALGHHRRNQGAVFDGAAMAGPDTGAATTSASDTGPVPEGLAVGGPAAAALPVFPDYAWPTYAPYPNFSAVGYPTVYPWQAWPNIGPFYPYPEPPLDWRAVTAKYHDGLWYVKFRQHYTRPFIFLWPAGELTAY